MLEGYSEMKHKKEIGLEQEYIPAIPTWFLHISMWSLG